MQLLPRLLHFPLVVDALAKRWAQELRSLSSAQVRDRRALPPRHTRSCAAHTLTRGTPQRGDPKARCGKFREVVLRMWPLLCERHLRPAGEPALELGEFVGKRTQRRAAALPHRRPR